MNEEIKYEKLIAKLQVETLNEKITWESKKVDIRLPHDGEVVDKVYFTQYKNHRFRLYKIRFLTLNFEYETSSWSSHAKLDIIDIHDDVEWSFPSYDSLDDLYNAVRLKTANISGLVEDILSDENKEEGKEQ